MIDLLDSPPCVIFALAREASAFYRYFKPQQSFPDAPCRARLCGPALVLETGVGARATDRALAWLPCRPKLILSAGYCGALHIHLRVGDIVLAKEVVDTSGGCWPVTWQTPSQGGRLLTAPTLAANPEQKRQLGQRHDADAVDMETARVARWCAERDIPFASVRAVSDDAHTALSPRLVSLLGGGRVVPGRLLANVARQPSLVGELWRLARQTRLASARLAVALAELLSQSEASLRCVTHSRPSS
jgi:adenosylhomocysteine nucleosidase